MITRLKAISLAAAAMMLSDSPASAHFFTGTAAYRTDYYNNASHDTLVGGIFPTGCTYDEFMETDTVNYHLVGQQTPYSTLELVGYCIQGEYNPV